MARRVALSGARLTAKLDAAARADGPPGGASGVGPRAERDAIGTDGGRGTPLGVAEKVLYRGNCYYEEDGGNVPGPPTGDPPALPAGADTPRMAGDRALVRTGRGGGAEG
ncbi:hypothetical protein [Micromonospora chersina]|uniref:hypothetical protein n=1 Tax=Micromonospora chersina TaxID=47854 RepID=UPI003722EE91